MRRIIIDSHADTMQFSVDNNLEFNNRSLSFNIVDIREYLPYIQFLSCFVHDKYVNNGYDRVNKILNHYFRQEENNKENIIRISNVHDIYNVANENKLGILLTIENGLAIDDSIDNLYELYKKGIKMMTITWNGNNRIGSGIQSKYDNGLTKFGKHCINVMNNINMIIDVSHSSVKTFWDTINYTRKPIMASHSNVYSICNNKRNLTDIQIKEIAKVKGIVGITFCRDFLTNKNRADIQDVVNHIAYICNLVGTEYVCIGSDFDGVEKENLPDNLKGVKDVYKLEECMLYNGFTKENIQDIMGNNLCKFLQNNL